MPIDRTEFETAKVKQDTTDELTVKILAHLKENPDSAFTTRELAELFDVKDSDQILMRCFKLKKERKIDGFKPKHQRLYYWILLKPSKANPRKLIERENNVQQADNSYSE